LKYKLATCVFSVTSTCCLDDWRLVDAELDVGAEHDTANWCATPVEKAAGAVENITLGGWLSGEEGWRAAALERGGEGGQRPVERGGGCCGDVVTLEHTRGGECSGGVVTLEHTRGSSDMVVVQ
jgi:hypothetical protein